MVATCDMVRFRLDGAVHAVRNPDPTLTVLRWLRESGRTGTKEGCAEGDCGACTVVLAEGSPPVFRAVNACILFLPMIDGMTLYTVESLSAANAPLHPVQQAMVDLGGSQCGFCTPGFVMSIYSHYRNGAPTDEDTVRDMLAGNLCRCTGYGPIIAAARAMDGYERVTEAAPEPLTDNGMLALTFEDPRGGTRRFFAPRNLGELQQVAAAHPGATFVAGATDVGLWVTKKLQVLQTMISVNKVAELRQMRDTGAALEIGAALRYTDAFAALAVLHPDLGDLLRRLGGVQVRNAGTIGGNIANGSPIGDTPPPLIALGATLVLNKGGARRTMSLEKFFLGYGKQDRQPGEFVEKIIVPKPGQNSLFRVYKLSKRFDQDISAVCAAIALRNDRGTARDVRIAFGGMAATPKRAVHAEAALEGNAWSEVNLRVAMAALEQDFTPLTDMRASARYRMEAAKNLLLRAFLESGVQAPARIPPRRGACPMNKVERLETGIEGGVGESLAHDSAHKHVTGRALYIDDIPEAPGTLHLALGLSERAHARIMAMDLARVRAAPGVVAVFTREDIPGENNVGPVFKDDPLFADGLVEYAGQAMFAVAAATRELARAAARLADITYEDRPAAITIAEAAAANLELETPQRMSLGDSAAALAAAPHRLKGRIAMGGQDHFYLEGQVSLAVPGEDRDMLIHSSTQHPSEMQHLVGHVLQIPHSAVTVEVRRMGGAFGGKETQAALPAAAAALAAARLGRPVKICLDRDDDMLLTGKRHDFEIDYDVGFDKDGRIAGIETVLSSRCGYSADLSLAINDRAMFHSDNAYFLNNVSLLSHRRKTHTVSNTAFRGFGGPQGMMGIERVMDAIAIHLGKDTLDVRKANLYGPAPRNITPYHQTVEDNIAPELIAALEKSSDYRVRRKAIVAFNAASPVVKRGIALTPVKFGISFTTTFLNQAGALIHVYTDGSVHLNHGGTEMGQGLYIKVAQVLAEEFQIDVGQVKIVATSTAKVPNTSATAASAGADLNGMAALDAARTIKGRLAILAAEKFGCDAAEIRFRAGRVEGGGKSLGFAELARAAHLARVSLSSTGYYATPKIQYDRAKHRGRPFFYYAYGAAVSEVIIDTLTGENRVTRVDILHDVGKSLNPAIDLGQIEGGFIQGMGWLTTEELVFDAKGRLTTHAPSTYKIPAASDRPEILNIALWDGHNAEETVHRSKAVGEPPLMLAISVFSALTDAVASVADYKLMPNLDAPATPERLLFAVEDIRSRA